MRQLFLADFAWAIMTSSPAKKIRERAWDEDFFILFSEESGKW